MVSQCLSTLIKYFKPLRVIKIVKLDQKHLKYFSLKTEFLQGGVLLMRPEVYININGFSNLYWNWGW